MKTIFVIVWTVLLVVTCIIEHRNSQLKAQLEAGDKKWIQRIEQSGFDWLNLENQTLLAENSNLVQQVAAQQAQLDRYADRANGDANAIISALMKQEDDWFKPVMTNQNGWILGLTRHGVAIESKLNF